jgi:hypothetical protein
MLGEADMPLAGAAKAHAICETGRVTEEILLLTTGTPTARTAIKTNCATALELESAVSRIA